MKSAGLIAILVLAIVLSGCIGGDRIGDVLKKPEEYNGKT